MGRVVGYGVSQVPTNGMLGGMAYQDPINVTVNNISVGSGTLTGTASQPLQVTGGAYVSGFLGVGSTIKSYSSSESLEVKNGYAAFINPSATVAPIYAYNTDTTSSTNQPYITLSDGSGNRGAIGVNYTDSALWIHGQNGIRFRGGGSSPGTTEWGRFDSNGNLGIGQTEPQGNLHLGTETGSNQNIVIHTANNGGARIRFREGGSLTTGFNEYSFGMAGAANKMTFEMQAQGEVAAITNNGISFPSGKGIDFSAAGNAAGMTSELLDDYEEGTWIPSWGSTGGSLGSITYDKQLGNYTKVGNMVFVECRLEHTSFNIGTGSGALLVLGLPFTVASSQGAGGSPACNGINFPDGTINITTETRENSNQFYAGLSTRDNASWVNLSPSGLSATISEIRVSFCYRTTS